MPLVRLFKMELLRILFILSISAEPVADPGFFVEGGTEPLGGGGTNLRCRCFLAKMCAKMKELDPIGGEGARRWCPPPLGSANVKAGVIPLGFNLKYMSYFICTLRENAQCKCSSIVFGSKRSPWNNKRIKKIKYTSCWILLLIFIVLGGIFVN